MRIRNCVYNLFIQVIFMILLLIIPIIWWNMLVEISTISNFLISLGIMLCLEGLSYLALPIDFIPDCIPYIGYIDDSFAWILIVFGIWFLLIGMIIVLGPYLLIGIFG